MKMRFLAMGAVSASLGLLLWQSESLAQSAFLDPVYGFFEYACHEDNTAVRNFIETSRYLSRGN